LRGSEHDADSTQHNTAITYLRDVAHPLADIQWRTADGNCGQKTEEAIKSAQAAFGMEQTGIADNAFQQKLFEGVAPAAGEGEGYVALSNGSTGDAVVRLQKRLAELGYYTGLADGGYGPKMVAAVKKAQAAFGLEETGVADVVFQQHLFGSVIAPTEAPAEDEAAAAEGEAAEAAGDSEG
jgi:peptidoglycan hydrolase-like protein with peptidoglycan-binding domain